MFKKLLTTRSLCLSAIIAALYAALTLLLAPISYGNIQCRVSEAFTVLPMVLPQSIPGLFVGCLIANIFSPTPSIWDIVFGSLTTLIAACGTYALRKKPVLAAACPIVANGVIVGLMLALLYGLPVALTMGEVAIGELGAVFLGMLLLTVLKSRVDFNKISRCNFLHPFRRNPAFVPCIPPFYFARLAAKYEKTVKIAKILSL